MSKHTPEPWSNTRCADGTIVQDRSGRVICEVSSDIDCRAGEELRRGYPDAERIVACVNACAGINPEAVPELLEACKQAQGYLRACHGTKMDLLEAAIAKAEGK